MSSPHETLMHGIIAMVFGVLFFLNRQRFIQMTAESHNRFWRGLLGMEGGIGRTGKRFVNAMVIALGCLLIVSGTLLIYRYFNEFQ